MSEPSYCHECDRSAPDHYSHCLTGARLPLLSEVASLLAERTELLCCLDKASAEAGRLDTLAASIRAEREACAKVAEAEFTGSKRNWSERETGMRIAEAIRARAALANEHSAPPTIGAEARVERYRKALDGLATLGIECLTDGETAPRPGCDCPTCGCMRDARAALADPQPPEPIGHPHGWSETADLTAEQLEWAKAEVERRNQKDPRPPEPKP